MVGAGQGISSPTTDWGKGSKRVILGRKHLLEELAGLRQIGQVLPMLEGSWLRENLLNGRLARSVSLIRSGTLKQGLPLHIAQTLIP